jgi:hypothetical protein
MFQYLQEEAEQAETAEDVANLLQLMKAILSETAPVNTVRGLPHIRAEVTSVQGIPDCNVATTVPECLVSTFYDLSDKMNRLQAEDPDTFANASNALHWLANNEKCLH